MQKYISKECKIVNMTQQAENQIHPFWEPLEIDWTIHAYSD